MDQKLLDAIEDFFNIARVFANDTAFEHCSVCSARSIANFAITNDTLIRVNLN